MKYLKGLLAAVAMTGMFSSVMTATPSARAGSNTCKDVKFKFTNSHRDGRDIKVVKVEHFSAHDRKWRTEDVADETCGQGRTCTTNGDNLAGVEARDISKVKFHYKVKDAAGNWTATIVGGEKAVSAAQQECRAGAIYGPWAITG